MDKEPFLSAYDRIFRYVIAKLAATSFVISALSTVLLWIIFAGSLHIAGDSWHATVSHLGIIPASLFVALFLILFFVTWFILYIGYKKEAEDIYSYLREKIKGNWIAEYDFVSGGKIVYPTRPKSRFEFIITPDKKIEMYFNPEDNTLFSDAEQNISVISLRNPSANKFTLIYYYNKNRSLTPEMLQWIEPEGGLTPDPSRIEIEVFGILNFEEPNAGEIKKMSGSWYDLNGNMKILGNLLREKAISELNDTNFKKKLSDFADVSGSAKMGKVDFVR